MANDIHPPKVRESEENGGYEGNQGTTPEAHFILAFKDWYQHDGSVGGLAQLIEDHNEILGIFK
jgi:hypothetical protein